MTQPRLLSLDIFRGMTVASMIIVNSQDKAHAFRWLIHSDWHGCTFADVVFPFFMMIMGVSWAFALTHFKQSGFSHRDILKIALFRSGYIFFLGFFLNLFPYHHLENVRIMGVLQRIAIGYLVVVCLSLTVRIRIQIYLVLGILLGYVFVLLIFGENIVGEIDVYLFTSRHLYTKTFDPEGLLSTLPAIASVVLGSLIGFYLLTNKSHKNKMILMFASGILCSLLALILHVIIPINKPLWSSSFVIWTTGLFLLSFSTVYALIEIKQCKKYFTVFELFGRYALLVYVVHILILKLQFMIDLHPPVGSYYPKFTSFCYSLLFIGCLYLMLLTYDKIVKQRLNHEV